MFMPAGTVGATLTFQYRIDAVGTEVYEDTFMVDVCRIELMTSICTGDLFGGPTVKVYTNADDTGGQWVSESIDLLALEEPDWDHLPRRFWLRFRAIPSAQDPVTTMYIDHVSIQVQGISGLAMDMNYVYVEDYFGNPQTVFQPGEAIRLGLDATNLTQETITATYFWTTVDAGEWVVSGLSYGPWATSALPGEEQDWYITRGVPSDAAAGAYTFSGRVDALAGSDSASLGFTVAGAPLPITYLEAFTCKDVQNNDPVEITDAFTTNDELVYVWTAWEGASGAHTIRWEWYRPDGTMLTPYSYPFEGEDLYYVWSSVYVAAMNQTGQWTIKIYMDDVYIALLTFTLTGSERLFE